MTEYQKYQLQWMINHGYSLDDLIQELANMQYDDPEDSDRISTPISELYDEWIMDVGFGSEIWVCEDEWKQCEAVDKYACPHCGRKIDDEIDTSFADNDGYRTLKVYMTCPYCGADITAEYSGSGYYFVGFSI